MPVDVDDPKRANEAADGQYYEENVQENLALALPVYSLYPLGPQPNKQQQAKLKCKNDGKCNIEWLFLLQLLVTLIIVLQPLDLVHLLAFGLSLHEEGEDYQGEAGEHVLQDDEPYHVLEILYNALNLKIAN